MISGILKTIGGILWDLSFGRLLKWFSERKKRQKLQKVQTGYVEKSVEVAGEKVKNKVEQELEKSTEEIEHAIEGKDRKKFFDKLRGDYNGDSDK